MGKGAELKLLYTEFEFSLKYLSENVYQVVGDTTLKLWKDSLAGALNSIIANTQTVSEDIVLSEMGAERMCVEGGGG